MRWMDFLFKKLFKVAEFWIQGMTKQPELRIFTRACKLSALEVFLFHRQGSTFYLQNLGIFKYRDFTWVHKYRPCEGIDTGRKEGGRPTCCRAPSRGRAGSRWQWWKPWRHSPGWTRRCTAWDPVAAASLHTRYWLPACCATILYPYLPDRGLLYRYRYLKGNLLTMEVPAEGIPNM